MDETDLTWLAGEWRTAPVTAYARYPRPTVPRYRLRHFARTRPGAVGCFVEQRQSID